MSLLEYADLETELNKTPLALHPSQAHGLICGILCGHTVEPKNWEELITGGKGSAKTREVLKLLFGQSEKQLKEFLFEFQLFLPDDAETLILRAEALTLWTQGFLTGLKIMQIPIVGREPSDTTEAIDDLIEIAKMNYEAVVGSEEDENAYMELVEYVRMAVILIYQDLTLQGEPEEDRESSDQLH